MNQAINQRTCTRKYSFARKLKIGVNSRSFRSNNYCRFDVPSHVLKHTTLTKESKCTSYTVAPIVFVCKAE